MIAHDATHTTHYRRSVNADHKAKCSVNRVLITVIIFKKLKDYDEVADVQNACEHSVETRENRKKKKVAVVPFSYTSTNPWAVMVVHFNACLAVAAVERPRRSINIARPTLGAIQRHALHHRNVVNLKVFLFFARRYKQLSQLLSLLVWIDSWYNAWVRKSRKKQECQTQAHRNHIENIDQRRLLISKLRVDEDDLQHGWRDDQRPRP